MRIKELREAFGLSQAELGRLVGIDQAGICRIEQGKQDVSLTQLRRFAEVFEVGILELIGDERAA